MCTHVDFGEEDMEAQAEGNYKNREDEHDL